jgi:radical SAM superfamily enzyme YgiQ (UPF0313 family)
VIKNILLVEPRSADANIFSKFQAPRMGLAVLAAKARKAGYNVRAVFQEKVPLARRHLLWADLVGFSILTSTAPEGYRLARLVRALDFRRGTRTPIVFGGVHATFRPEEALDVGDYVLRGEADDTWVPFLHALESQDPGAFDGVAGLSYRRGADVAHNPLPSPVDLDQVPTPDWSVFEGMHRGAPGSYGVAMTSRGCPHDCRFCSVTPMFGRSYRARSIDRVLEDLGATTRRHVFFYDDHFAASPRRTKELLRRIIAERGRTHRVRSFSAQVRVDTARDAELLDLFAAAGFTTLYLGFESVNPETLKLYRKGQTVGDSESAIREIHRRGIAVHGMFVFGSDADSPAVFRATQDFARRMRLETVQFLILTPLPGSELYDDLEQANRIWNRDWTRYDAHSAVYVPERMTPHELQAGTVRAMLTFYSPWEALMWLVRGRPRVAALRLGGWLTLLGWAWRHRRELRTMRNDSRELLLPDILRAPCARSASLVTGDAR